MVIVPTGLIYLEWCERMKIGILCGHEINYLFDKNSNESISVDTRYGSVHLQAGKSGNHQIFFINRHGKQNNLPPHRINYQANIQALTSAHVDCVISIGTVGSMNKKIRPGDFVVPHDFFDATRLRSVSFFDDQRVHVDMTDPFCPTLRNQLIETCENNEEVTVHKNGVYVTTEGPRLETASEIRFYSSLGEIIGMTLVPEVILAREKGLCYASFCIVCNMAAGFQKHLPVDDIKKVYCEKESHLAEIIKRVVTQVTFEHSCECKKKREDSKL